MIAALVLSHAFVLLIGAGVGARIRYRRSETRWVLRGQQQAELTHGGWHPVVAEGWNGAAPQGRKRADDHQFVTREDMTPMHRPVLYDQP